MTGPRLSGVSRKRSLTWDGLGMGGCENSSVQTLMVAGAGGHLEELHMLRPRLVGISDQVTWVTADTVQSRTLLGDDDLFFDSRRRHTIARGAVPDRFRRSRS